MPRSRSPARDKAKELWLKDKTRKLKDIASELEVSESQIRKWKNQDDWERKGKGTLPKTKSNVTNQNVTNAEPEIVIDNPDLTDRQIMFCIEYLKRFNATKAYQRAYPKANYATAMREGHRLKNTPKIAQEILRLKNEQNQEAMYEANDLFRKQLDIAHADITDYVEFGHAKMKKKQKDGEVDEDYYNYLRLKDSGEVDGTLIESITEGREGVNIKLVSKSKALDYLERREERKRKLELMQLDIDIKTEQLKEVRKSGGKADAKLTGYIDMLSEVFGNEDDGNNQ